MSDDEENEIIRREFRRRNRRGTAELLKDLQRRLTRRGGWAPRLDAIASKARRLGIDVDWNAGSG